MKMKNTLLVILVCAIIMGIGVVAFSGRKPFKNLAASNIVSATVHLTPPDKTIQIAEIDTLATYLNEVVIYQEDDSYSDYDGQAVTFTLTLSDGAQMEIMAYNPFLVINGTGYKTKYEPCEKLNNYANGLLREIEG